MQEDDFLVLRDDDIARLGQENELLSLEVEVLRAKISNVDSLIAEKNAIIKERNRTVSERSATIGKRNRTIMELRSRLKESEDKALIDKELLQELEQAGRDLQWTLNRLLKTPLVGPLISRRAGFERLAEKYLRE